MTIEPTPLLGDSRTSSEAPVLVLRWISPDLRAIAVDRSVVRIGRSDAAESHINDKSASRDHAVLRTEGEVTVLSDLGSANGTYVNGQRVEQVVVVSGDVVRIGGHVGVFCLETPSRIALGFREVAPGLWGSEGLVQALGAVDRVAEFGLPITIVAEAGAGKLTTAEALHCLSRRKGPLSALKCSTLTPAEAGGELFGTGKDAHSGPLGGYVGRSKRGTLFLDQIDELPSDTQSRLVRLLNEEARRPPGAPEAADGGTQLIAALSEHPDDLVKTGRLRQDLALRLSSWTICLPPLRERREDIVPLFFHFLRQEVRRRGLDGSGPVCSPRLLERISLYDWPGNVAELLLVTKRLWVSFGDRPQIHSGDLPSAIRDASTRALTKHSPATGQSERGQHLDELAEALRATQGNIKAAALKLGVARTRVYRWMNGVTVQELMARKRGGQ